MVEVLNPAVFDNIHAELHKLFDVVAERARVGGDVIFLQIGRYMIYFRYLADIALLIFYYIYNHTVVNYYAKEMVLEFMIWEGEAIMNDLNYKESSYNFEFPYEDDESKRILYNSRTNALALIDKENCETLCAANCETLCAANCSLCGARSCVGKMVPEPYGG